MVFLLSTAGSVSATGQQGRTGKDVSATLQQGRTGNSITAAEQQGELGVVQLLQHCRGSWEWCFYYSTAGGYCCYSTAGEAGVRCLYHSATGDLGTRH